MCHSKVLRGDSTLLAIWRSILEGHPQRHTGRKIIGNTRRRIQQFTFMARRIVSTRIYERECRSYGFCGSKGNIERLGFGWFFKEGRIQCRWENTRDYRRIDHHQIRENRKQRNRRTVEQNGEGSFLWWCWKDCGTSRTDIICE